MRDARSVAFLLLYEVRETYTQKQTTPSYAEFIFKNKEYPASTVVINVLADS